MLLLSLFQITVAQFKEKISSTVVSWLFYRQSKAEIKSSKAYPQARLSAQTPFQGESKHFAVDLKLIAICVAKFEYYHCYYLSSFYHGKTSEIILVMDFHWGNASFFTLDLHWYLDSASACQPKSFHVCLGKKITSYAYSSQILYSIGYCYTSPSSHPTLGYRMGWIKR